MCETGMRQITMSVLIERAGIETSEFLHTVRYLEEPNVEDAVAHAVASCKKLWPSCDPAVSLIEPFDAAEYEKQKMNGTFGIEAKEPTLRIPAALRKKYEAKQGQAARTVLKKSRTGEKLHAWLAAMPGKTACGFKLTADDVPNEDQVATLANIECVMCLSWLEKRGVSNQTPKPKHKKRGGKKK